MPSWRDLLHGDPLPWLLEPDPGQPAVRYIALRDLLGRGEGSVEVRQARAEVMSSGPVPAIIAAQRPEGYWVKPGPGYAPKYTGTVWQLTFLSQLGAEGSHPRVRLACEYVLSHSVESHGGFSCNGTPSTFIHCLAGNLGAALCRLGLERDERVHRAMEWQARLVTAAGVAAVDSRNSMERYYKSGTCGPLFACSGNLSQPCAWGAVKAVLALTALPPLHRSATMRRALECGVDFLLSTDPAVADYPHPWADRPSQSWFKFGYPLAYVTDVLQNVEALVAAGKAGDPRLAHALEMVVGKQDAQGRWRMEYTYNGKTWADVESKGKPSKWVTLRALRVLKAAYP